MSCIGSRLSSAFAIPNAPYSLLLLCPVSPEANETKKMSFWVCTCSSELPCSFLALHRVVSGQKWGRMKKKKDKKEEAVKSNLNKNQRQGRMLNQILINQILIKTLQNVFNTLLSIIWRKICPLTVCREKTTTVVFKKKNSHLMNHETLALY